MTTPKFDEIASALLRLRDLPLAERQHDLERLRQQSPELYKEVRSLLIAAPEADLQPDRLACKERAEIERHPQVAADTLLGVYQTMGDDTLIASSVQVAR